jgi:hypothetical protein
VTTAELVARLRSLKSKFWAGTRPFLCGDSKKTLTLPLPAETCKRKGEILASPDNTAGRSTETPLQRAPGGARTALSFAQQRLWFLDQLDPRGIVYNIPRAVRIRGALDTAALQQSLNEVARRHESLRTTFPAIETDLAPCR